VKEQTVTAKIHKLNSHGKGVGSFINQSGQPFLAEVPFTVPGDEVEAVVKRGRSGQYPARLLSVTKPSHEAIPQRCLHFFSCGGCSFQRLPYERQALWKEDKVRRLFQDLLLDTVRFQPILASTDPWTYRNKMEFSFSQDKHGDRYLGMFLAGTRGRVFNLTECHLVSPWFAETLAKVRNWWVASGILAYNPPKNSGSLRTLTLRESKTTGERLAMLTVSGNPEDAIHRKDIETFKSLFDDHTSVYLRIHQAIKGQPTQFYEMHLKGKESIEEKLTVELDPMRKSTLHFSISPSAFFQPNTLQAKLLYQEALKLAELSEEDVVYDLYCGTGTLGALASRFVAKVVGIELSPESSLDARENAKANQLHNVEIITGDVGLGLKERTETPTLVLLDPPRAGLSLEAVNQVADFKPQRIVYISCNPETQVRDIHLFLERGYTLEVVQPVDQFPQTPHIENIALLTFRKD
jgi:23S rRNA (uracil1939-C5)-methyltransferase